MLKRDIETYNKNTTNSGLLYIIGLVLIILISLIKVCVGIVHDIHYRNVDVEQNFVFKPKPNAELNYDVLLSIESSNIPNEDLWHSDTKIIKNSEELAEQRALESLRDYFLVNEVLKGDILKTTVHRYSKDDTKPYIVQRVSFGKDLNMLLHLAFKLELKRNRLTGDSYLVFVDGGTYDLERTLQQTYYCDNIIIELFDKEPKKV